MERLRTVLAPLCLKHDWGLSLWDDSQIIPGEKWREALEAQLAGARLALLLVSGQFLASEFVMALEMPLSLEAAEKDGRLITWVLLRPCLWQLAPMSNIQALWPPRHSLAELPPEERKTALKTIALAIRDALLLDSRQVSQTPSSQLPQHQANVIRWRARLRLFREPLAEGVELPMVLIPSERRGEWLLAAQPISLRQWRVVAGWPSQGHALNPSPAEGQEEEDLAVTGIGQADALEFCRRLAARTGRYYELPSEAQWEHACRAGGSGVYSWGDAWSSSLAAETANPWGLRSMHGGVWEWCRDGLRGGSWNDSFERRTAISRADPAAPPHPSTTGLRVCCLPFGTPYAQLEASRRQWRPAVRRSACEQALGWPLTWSHFEDLLRGLRQFRILTLPRLRFFLSLVAERRALEGKGWDEDPSMGRDFFEGTEDRGNRQPDGGERFRGAGVLVLTGQAEYTAFAERMGDETIVLGPQVVAASYPYSSAAFCWQRRGANERADEASSPEAFWSKMGLGAEGRRLKNLNRLYQNAVASFPDPLLERVLLP